MLKLNTAMGLHQCKLLKLFSAFVVKIIIFCHAFGSGLGLAHGAQVQQNTQQMFSVLTWNIQKGLNRDWIQGLGNHFSDIYVLQEATSEPEVLLSLSTVLNPDFTHVFNSAWTMNDGHGTGTMNLSHFEHVNSVNLLSVDVEPIVATPKSMIVTDYNVPGCGLVRVVNLHMINFNLGWSYERQLSQLTPYIENYKGPLIVAGDFNNWNAMRNDALRAWSHQLELTYVEAVRHSWFLTLDHIFYKGPLKLVTAEEFEIHYSDHYPLRATFQCE